MFGLNAHEGNHGEDVKEYYFYLDNTPTHSYMKCVYKYPHAAYPYEQLLEENRRRNSNDREYELVDTGIFDQGRYFDVEVEYAKVSPEDILIRINVSNRGPEAASLHVLPTYGFGTHGRGDATILILFFLFRRSLHSRMQSAVDSRQAWELGEYMLYLCRRARISFHGE